MYKLPHIIFILFAAAAVASASIIAKNIKLKTVQSFLKVSAVIMLAFDPVYWIWEYNKFGALDLSTTLPLYLCSLFWILLPIAAFAAEGKLKRAALSNICTVGLLGGILGIIFNVYLDHHAFWSFIPIRSLIYHLFMVLIPSVLWFSKYYTPKIEDTYLCFAPVLILLIPCVITNHMFGWDYCYTNGGPGTPLTLVSKNMPKGLFVLFLYSSLLAAINFIFYTPVIFAHLRKKGFIKSLD